MPVHPTSYQRLFHRDLFLSALSHSTRSGMTRRHLSDRLCLCISALLLFYIGYYTFIMPYRTRGFQRDPAEELAYIKAINRSLPMIENTQICSLDAIDLLFVIISSGSHFLERQSIRETWGSMPDLFGVHSQRIFVIGYHFTGNFYKDILNEAQHEQDLLYLTVDDNSHTLKELHVYRWLQQHCSTVQYIFKTEDDLFVNSLLLHELVRELKTNSDKFENRNLYNVRLDSLFRLQSSTNGDRFLFGWAYQSAPPERNNTGSPYRITYDEYPKELYPRYCSGFGYFMNMKTRDVLTNEAFKDKKPFRFADIYITGILPERLNFVCEIFPFTYHQGSMETCMNIIKKSNSNDSSSSPLIVCSTGRHTGQNAYSDYYKIWTELKHIYNDKINPKNE